MSKTKVLYLISSLTQGGAERHLVDLVRGLDSSRWETQICVLKNQVHYAREVPAGQPHYILDSSLWASPFAFGRLIAAIRAFRPQILHTYMNDANLWGRLATAFVPAEKPHVITSVHLDDMSRPYRALERRLASRSTRIVAHSRSIERLLVNELGISEERIIVIPNGIDEQEFRPAAPEERAKARAARGMDGNDFIALMPARLAPQKNQTLVVGALAYLKATGELPPHFRLLLAGRVSSTGYARSVHDAVAAGNLGSQVQFLGPVTGMKELYATADVVLMPSQTEASPIAALEALACAVPVLISAAANTDQVLIPDRHGWQIEDASRDVLVKTLAKILRTSSEERLAMGVSARAHVLNGFTRTRVTADFHELYQRITSPAQARVDATDT